MTTHSHRAAALRSLAIAAMVAASAPASAQDRPVPAAAAQQVTRAERTQTFAIAPQPLNTALEAFSKTTGISFAYSTDQISGRQSPGASGRLTPREALARLLAGTGIDFRFSGTQTVSLVSASGQVRRAGPLEANPLLVEATIPTRPRRNAAADVPFTTPGSRAYISREQIERVQPSSPGDIFIETPGVLSGASHDGTSINVNIRSAQGLNRVRVMVEGTQQESSGYQGYAGADQRTYVDPELIGGVEITKGPGGGAYSTGTTAGIVNVRLLETGDLVKEGRDIGLRVRSGFGGNAVAPRFGEFVFRRGADTGLELDSNNTITQDDNWFYSFAGAYTTDRFDLLAAHSRRREGNYFAGQHGPETFTAIRQTSDGPQPGETRFTPIEENQEVPNTSEDTQSLLLKGTLRLPDGQSLEAGFTRYDSEFGQVFPSSINLWPPQQFGLNDVTSQRYWLRYKWESGNDLINLQVNLWGSSAEERGEVRQSPQENDAWGVEVWNASFFKTGLGDMTLTYGAEYTTSEALVEGPSTISGIRYVRGQGGTNISELVSPAFDGRREVFGGYLNAALAPNDWLTLTAGVRYDRFNAEGNSFDSVCDVDFTPLNEALAMERAAFARYADSLNTADPAIIEAALEAWIAAQEALGPAFLELDGYCGGAVVDTENEGDRVSPRIGITFEPLDGLQLFAQYSEGFRALSLVELGQTFDGPVIVNPDLEAEVVSTWEVGVNFLRDGLFFDDDVFRARFVYFNNDYDNFIVRSGFVSSGQGGTRFFFENVPDVSVSGYETSLSYDVGRVFADLNFNAFDDSLDVPTQANIDQPEYAGTLTLGTRWLNGDLVLGARINAFGEPNTDGDIDVGFDSGRYWAANEIVDLFGSYEINDNFAIGFSLENASDQFYTSPLFVSRIPAPGRTLRMNFTTTF